ncbi:DNA primase [Streptomyces sp. WAC 00631]|uniref:DNA primase n=1 Tax=Streptomyces sp. WAC 00631 TaxID=2203201 RepID=UPI001E5FFE35|nr:DNA primase [Streptomyces sp. WAC 00631]MCC5034285.1 DNA primase [Streptomyces sp. WAC 00631]
MSAMDNRLAMTLAVGAGYLLGRTKKAKLALGVGGMVLGKRLNLNPQQLTGLLTEQLKNNPQLAEVRDQLRNDLQGVGRAAATAVVTRRLDALSDRLHDRTLGVQDKLGAVGGKVAGGSAAGSDADRDEDKEEAHDTRDADAGRGATGKGGGTEQNERPARKPARAAKKAPASGAGRPAKKTASSAASSAGKAGRAAKKTTARRRTTGGDDRG